MGSVLCITRSGAGGICAQNGAVRVARARGDRLVFLFVAYSSFLSRLAALIIVDINAILERLGWYPLCSAVERVSAESVKSESLTRYGV